ncbi:COG4705 family protein [Streptomyces sp. NBC_00400]|uniref:COG4705 family protein n=1 Tax=Streptomyces sp. NBC_00400 TaxID=2975737 RepID=UPI003FA6ECA5
MTMTQSSSKAPARPVGEERSRTPTPDAGHGPGWSKVPQVTAVFWGVKVLTTGMGETASDYLGRTLGPIPAGSLGLAGLVALLILQFRTTRYRPWIYWSAIVMVSVFGTMAADVVHVIAGIPYPVSALAFSAGLAAILTAWYVSEGTLSIHSIRTRRRETFYWATVLATFALGTAAGDLTAGTLHWGYLPSGILFTALIAVPALSRRFFGLNAVAAFWWAYVLTRPLGASFADWMGVSTSRGGLGWGTGPVTLALIVPIVLLVGYLAVSHKDTPPEQPATGTAA